MAKNLLSQELTDILVQQMCHERFNAALYLYIAGYLKNKGLDKLASKFESQYDEENSHNKLIYDFLVDMNSPISMDSVDSADFEIKSILDIANAYLSREVLTTKSLEEIKNMCISENNGVAEEFLRQMINRQRAELEEANTFYDQSELCENDWKFVFMWNNSIEV